MTQAIKAELIRLLPPKENKVVILKANGLTIEFNDPEEGNDFLKCFFNMSEWDIERYYNKLW